MKAFQGYAYIGASHGIAMRNVLTEGMKMYIFELVCTVQGKVIGIIVLK